MVIVLMGVSGAGKSTVGRALAERLRWPFLDADDLHSPASVAKMAQGIALDDVDRQEWLARLHDQMAAAASQRTDLVVACSALRERYRRQLAAGVADVRWVYLRADPAVLRGRLAARRGHFAGPELLDSQLAALEPPVDAVQADAALPVGTLVEDICRALRVITQGP